MMSECRDASVDQDGRMVMCDIATGTPVVSLEDFVLVANAGLPADKLVYDSCSDGALGCRVA